MTTTAAGLAAYPLAGSVPSASAAQRADGGEHDVRVVASANGRAATRRAFEMITAGEDPLDAVVAGVNLVEDDPSDMSVGYGGLPNEDGVVELDAAVMHGPTHQAGAVASLRHIKNPSKVARLVMRQTDHIMLVGEGALSFALAHGFPEENLLTDKARRAWLKWKQDLSEEDDWLPPPEADDETDRPTAGLLHAWASRPTGTIHCSGRSAAGDLSCVTTTSGLAFKIPGRVGDSPIIAAGLYVDNEIGSCGCTGRGEEVIRNACSFAAVELMRGGMSPREAGLEVMRRVVEHASPRLMDGAGRPKFDLRFYLLRKDGAHAGVGLWGPAKYAVTDTAGTRLEECAVLYER